MSRLVHPDVEIHTARTTHRGREAAVAWAAKRYDHLVRRYAPATVEPTATGVAVTGNVEYVWRETGKVGDSSPVRIELGVRDGLISSWTLHEEPE